MRERERKNERNRERECKKEREKKKWIERDRERYLSIKTSVRTFGIKR
jgi:hypothetical protein